MDYLAGAESGMWDYNIYLEGQGYLLGSLIRRITRLTITVIGVINLLTKSP